MSAVIFPKCIFRKVKHSISFLLCTASAVHQTNGNWFALLNFPPWKAVLVFGVGIELLLEYIWILQIGFSLIRWNQLTRKVIANGFYKCIKIYYFLFFFKRFLTLRNVAFSFLCHWWKVLWWIYPLVPFSVHSWAVCMCVYICWFCSHFAPGAAQSSLLVAWAKPDLASYEEVILKSCLKWHRAQGLVRNVSKADVNAVARMCAAALLRKAVGPGCFPSAIGNLSWGFPKRSLWWLCTESKSGDEADCPAAAWRSVEMRSGLCLPFLGWYCLFDYL